MSKRRVSPSSSALTLKDRKPLAPGAILKNPELAESLRRISRDGARGFYQGPTAEAIVSTLNAGGHPATIRDLAGYAPQSKEPLCTEYRGHTVLSAPPPQTGMRVLHTLELLEGFDLAVVAFVLVGSMLGSLVLSMAALMLSALARQPFGTALLIAKQTFQEQPGVRRNTLLPEQRTYPFLDLSKRRRPQCKRLINRRCPRP